MPSIATTKINVEACPFCGSLPKSITQHSQHTCGEYFETVIFKCGFEISWKPNISSAVAQGHCPNMTLYKLINKNRAAAKHELLTVINGLHVDESYKKRLLMAIEHI